MHVARLVLRDVVETLRVRLQGKRLRDFIVRRQIGGKDPTAARGGAGYSLHGVCSYVYLVELRGGDGTQLAMKVLINTTAGDQSVRIREEQMAEYALLQDSARMPPHPNILSGPGTRGEPRTGGLLELRGLPFASASLPVCCALRR